MLNLLPKTYLTIGIYCTYYEKCMPKISAVIVFLRGFKFLDYYWKYDFLKQCNASFESPIFIGMIKFWIQIDILEQKYF